MTNRLRLTSVALVLALAATLAPALAPAAAQDLDDFERARILRVLSLLQRGPDASSPARPAAKAASLAADSGAISGTVGGLDLEGYASATVVAWSADSGSADDGEDVDAPNAIARAMVQRDGTYRLDGLVPGPYYVSAMAKGYETRYYDDALEVSSATTVEVAEGETVEGIDFALERFNAGEGSIAGVVTSDADGGPIAGAVVHAFAADSPFMYGLAETDEAGRYAIRNLRSGGYVVEVWSQEYLPEFYGDVTQCEQAVLVSVVEPEQTDGIDFGLALGGSIAGVVRNADGGPVAGAYVSAIVPRLPDGQSWSDDDEEGRLAPAVPGGWAVSDESGAYRMGGLTTGEYRVQAQFATRWQYVSVWYEGAGAFDQATPVAVTTGQETAGIDMTLELPVMDSGVAGRVTGADGHPVAGAYVTVQEAVEWAAVDSLLPVGEGVPVDSVSPGGSGTAIIPMPETETTVISRVWAHAPTDEDGRYTIDELPAGTYIVSAASKDGWEYVQRWYVDGTTPEDATEVVLAAGERLADIDIVLPLRVATASISGAVRDQDGNPLAWAFVQVSPPEGDRSTSGDEPARLWAYGQTDNQGVYRVDRLPAGTYTVHASYNTGDRFGQSWYDGADGPQTAMPVVLAEGETRTGLDMQVVVRPLYGVVAGTVTDASSGSPVGRAYVELSPVYRDVVRDAPLRYGASSTVTDESGTFRLEWIPEGVYSLTVYANGATADYVHPDTDALSTPFQVVGGETALCDVALTVQYDGAVVITGTVTASPAGPGPLFGGGDVVVEVGVTPGDATVGGEGVPWSAVAPLEIAVVVALPVASPDAGVRYTAVTDPVGSYTLRGLPPGDYAVMCFAPNHIGTYYDGAYAPDRAQTIHVDGERPVEGIDFELAGLYWHYAVDEDRAAGGELAPTNPAAAGSPAVYGNVADDSGHPVEDATVYLLDAREQPVAFARTGGDGRYELSGLPPGEYRLYASRLGYTGTYNGNQHDFAAAEPLNLASGQTEVDLVLSTAKVTAVEEDADTEAAIPLAMALHCNYPNPFNPETRIAFSVPASGRATVRIHNALGQRVATLYNGVAEAGQPYEVVFHAHGLGAGTYFYALEFEGRRLTRPMSLVK